MRNYSFDYTLYKELLVPLLKEIIQVQEWTPHSLRKIIKKYPKADGTLFAKDQLLSAYRELAGTEEIPPYNQQIQNRLKMKPVRTLSGVSPITVLTKPFPCPGKCIFCPNDIRMPKSYLSDEPGAQRAERNYFDPYLQTYNRLLALQTIGHEVQKAEILVLGGTWSFYPEKYQIWFIKECFRALNDFGNSDGREVVEQRYERMSKELELRQAHGLSNDPRENKKALQHKQIFGQHLDKSYNQVVSEVYVAPERLAGFDQYQQSSWEELEHEQRRNEQAASRCVGLVIETRPDNISEAEVIRIRRLGCTKTQIGVQSLQDTVLSKNNRGHDVAATRRAFRLLRQAGFKIHAHWMANLYGSSVEQDIQDYTKLFSDPDFQPDELKIYPCSLIASAELMKYHQEGLWKPYSHEELLQVVSFCLSHTPPYCRLTRVIRDIPSTDIVTGNTFTNFRQMAEQELDRKGEKGFDIRAREIKAQQFDVAKLQLDTIVYETSVSTEMFLQYVVNEAETKNISHQPIVGFLRLSLPKEQSFIPELHDSAIIREVHVYGETVGLGDKKTGKAQHGGLGTKLIDEARRIATDKGFATVSVISAIGTREYYRKKGFSDGTLYQKLRLT